MYARTMKTGIALGLIGLIGCIAALMAPEFTSGAASEEESQPFVIAFGLLFVVSIVQVVRSRNA